MFVHTSETFVGRASAQPAVSRRAARWLLTAAVAALLVSDAAAAARQPHVPAHRKTDAAAAHAKVRPAQHGTRGAAPDVPVHAR